MKSKDVHLGLRVVVVAYTPDEAVQRALHGVGQAGTVVDADAETPRVRLDNGESWDYFCQELEPYEGSSLQALQAAQADQVAAIRATLAAEAQEASAGTALTAAREVYDAASAAVYRTREELRASAERLITATAAHSAA